MPDITMCRNLLCPMNRECYRYMAKPDTLQSYSEFIPRKINNNYLCEYFEAIRKNDKLNERK